VKTKHVYHKNSKEDTAAEKHSTAEQRFTCNSPTVYRQLRCNLSIFY